MEGRPVPEAKRYVAESERRLALPVRYRAFLKALRTSHVSGTGFIRPFVCGLCDRFGQIIAKRLEVRFAGRTSESLARRAKSVVIVSPANAGLDSGSVQFPKGKGTLPKLAQTWHGGP